MALESSATGDRRIVTILFTDIVGSTTHAEKLDPEEWKEIVNGAHKRVSEAVVRYEGTVAQLLGDGVLAFFGAPAAHEDDPARAVRAALDIQRAMVEYASELRGVVDEFQMRVGINTGPVVVGTVGSAEHSEYLAVGDAVNLAARLQGAAQPGKVLISGQTARFLQGVFALNDLGDITVKGKKEPVRVYEVIEQRAAFSSGRGVAGLTSPLVGREREFELLKNALSELGKGRGQIVAVIGEPGIGKSRLVEEARKQRADGGQQTAIRFLEGRALSYGQTLSFWTITQLVQNDLELGEGSPEIRIKVALRRRVKGLFGDKAAEIFPYLAHLLGVKLEGEEGERVSVLDGETLKRQILISLGDYFSKVAEEQPTVLVFEDLHWGDPSSLEALERLLRVTRRGALMIVMLTRREADKPAWRMIEQAAREQRERYTEIELEPLTPDASEELVSNLLEIADLPAQVRELILARAEGNPLYVEEIVRELIERGAITRDGDGWKARGEIRGIEIPETLQGILLARIDRLQEDVKRTLQLASVIGRSFLYKLLEAISEAERELDWHVSQLERADLVREKARMPELEYMFKHSLTQEAAYESLLQERRKEFHRRVGEALEKLFAERAEDFLGLLAYHFDKAGEQEKAIDYLIRAGDKARLSDEQEEAVQFYERARDLLLETRDLERAAKTWLKLGLIYHANFEFEKAHEANETAFRLNAQAASISARRETLSKSFNQQTELRLSPIKEPAHLDPGRAVGATETPIIYNLFIGLVEIDFELNIVPACARSWEVLDAGTRYLFHLRDDMQWTNSDPVTASDYEWAWRRNLRLNSPGMSILLDDIEGAIEFRRGETSDPDSVGVHALDALTLEVRLKRQTPYFLYITGLPISYPLPRKTIEEFGEHWWRPEHIVTNGAFRLLEYEHAENDQGYKLVLERNVNYFGKFEGNVDRAIVFQTSYAQQSRDEFRAWRGKQFLANELDLVMGMPIDPTTGELVVTNISRLLQTDIIVLNPTRTPIENPNVRRALFLALDRELLMQAETGIRFDRPATGGLVPPGMAAHSPGIGLKHDLESARRLLAQAGFPDGKKFPILQAVYDRGRTLVQVTTFLNELSRQWREGLGIDVQFQPDSPEIAPDLSVGGWILDYPDPDNLFRVWVSSSLLGKAKWHDPVYSQLIHEVANITDRPRRLELYRQADQLLVVDKTLVYPRSYGQHSHAAKVWVKNSRVNPMLMLYFKNIVIEPH